MKKRKTARNNSSLRKIIPRISDLAVVLAVFSDTQYHEHQLEYYIIKSLLLKKRRKGVQQSRP